MNCNIFFLNFHSFTNYILKMLHHFLVCGQFIALRLPLKATGYHLMEMGITELMLRISKLHPFLLQGQLDNHV